MMRLMVVAVSKLSLVYVSGGRDNVDIYGVFEEGNCSCSCN